MRDGQSSAPARSARAPGARVHRESSPARPEPRGLSGCACAEARAARWRLRACSFARRSIFCRRSSRSWSTSGAACGPAGTARPGVARHPEREAGEAHEQRRADDVERDAPRRRRLGARGADRGSGRRQRGGCGPKRAAAVLLGEGRTGAKRAG
jgi:hypothetical protein